MSKLHKLKKANGEVLAINEISERRPMKVRNFGVFLRYNSLAGTHNLYKEFRDTSRVGAFSQLYVDMASHHRAAFNSIQIIDVKELKPSECRRPNVTQFHGQRVKFALPHVRQRSSARKYRTTFKAQRPHTVF